MKWLVRLGVILLSIIGGMWAMPVLKVSSGDNVSSSIRYVALGDSIAHGYGLGNPEKDSYVGQVKQYLEENYDYVFAENFGTNGMRSDELLDILTNPENDMYNKYHATLQHADIVTISIGSNDLMHLIKLDMDMKEYIEKGDAIFRGACRRFDENFPRIIAAIREIVPDAKICADNVYNPCNGLKEFKDLHALAERYINLLNRTFTENNGYTLVDIKSEFDKSEDKLVNMALKGKEIDPHPNKKGHALIGKIVIKAIAD